MMKIDGFWPKKIARVRSVLDFGREAVGFSRKTKARDSTKKSFTHIRRQNRSDPPKLVPQDLPLTAPRVQVLHCILCHTSGATDLDVVQLKNHNHHRRHYDKVSQRGDMAVVLERRNNVLTRLLVLLVITASLIFVASSIAIGNIDTQGNSLRPPLANAPTSTTSKQATGDRPYDKFCGGRKIFIDVGALDGDTLEIFERLRANSQQYQCYAWECNTKNLQQLRTKVQEKLQLSIDVIDKAAWITDTTLRFTAGAANAGKLVAGDARSGVRNSNTYPVEAMDLAKWIRDKFTVQDFVFLKIDIEAAEFDVLPHLIETGTLAWIDEIQLEWHDWGQFNSPEHTKARQALETQIQDAGLIYKYATFDMDLYNPKHIDWSTVPKYFHKSEYPKPWIDSHYFRGVCASSWDVDIPTKE
eukprot:scaffold3576_cov170-Amphora_coffeaeformis.AAC.5